MERFIHNDLPGDDLLDSLLGELYYPLKGQINAWHLSATSIFNPTFRLKYV